MSEKFNEEKYKYTKGSYCCDELARWLATGINDLFGTDIGNLDPNKEGEQTWYCPFCHTLNSSTIKHGWSNIKKR